MILGVSYCFIDNKEMNHIRVCSANWKAQLNGRPVGYLT